MEHAPDTRVILDAAVIESTLAVARSAGVFHGFARSYTGWRAFVKTPAFASLGVRFPVAVGEVTALKSQVSSPFLYTLIMDGLEAALAAQAAAAAIPGFLKFDDALKLVPTRVKALRAAGKSFPVGAKGYALFHALTPEEGGLTCLPRHPHLMWKGNGWTREGYKLLMGDAPAA